MKPIYCRVPTFILLLNLFSISCAYASDSIKVAMIASGAQKTVASTLLLQYEKLNPGTKIQLIALPDREFKIQLPIWLNSEDGPDIINWQAGERLFRFVRNQQLQPINPLLTQKITPENFSKASLGAVTYNNLIYGIPSSYYQWGIFYRKSLFKQYNLSVPVNWTDFLTLCRILKQNNVTPLALGNLDKWPAAAWFDYLNLRINGQAFHTDLLQGKVSFFDQRVTNVIQHWKILIDEGYFLKYSKILDWDEVLPFIYHKKAAMTLIGNFFAGEMPDSLEEDFGFFPFPIIDPTVARFEEAPLDAFIVPKYTKITPKLTKFIQYLASAEFQSEYNEGLGTIPPNLNAQLANNRFIQQGSTLLSSAEAVSQYFDRDTRNQFVEPAISAFAEFITSSHANQLQTALEKARLSVFEAAITENNNNDE